MRVRSADCRLQNENENRHLADMADGPGRGTERRSSHGQPSRTREPSRPSTSSRTRVLLVVVKGSAKLGTAAVARCARRRRSVRPPSLDAPARGRRSACGRRSARSPLGALAARCVRRRSHPRRQSTAPSAPPPPILARCSMRPPSLDAPAVARCVRRRSRPRRQSTAPSAPPSPILARTPAPRHATWLSRRRKRRGHKARRAQ